MILLLSKLDKVNHRDKWVLSHCLLEYPLEVLIYRIWVWTYFGYRLRHVINRGNKWIEWAGFEVGYFEFWVLWIQIHWVSRVFVLGFSYFSICEFCVDRVPILSNLDFMQVWVWEISKFNYFIYIYNIISRFSYNILGYFVFQVNSILSYQVLDLF